MPHKIIKCIIATNPNVLFRHIKVSISAASPVVDPDMFSFFFIFFFMNVLKLINYLRFPHRLRHWWNSSLTTALKYLGRTCRHIPASLLTTPWNTLTVQVRNVLSLACGSGEKPMPVLDAPGSDVRHPGYWKQDSPSQVGSL